MSKVLLVNGSSRQEGNTSVALAEVAAALEGHGIETETMWLGNKPVNDCIACGKCAELGGKCAIDNDVVNELIAKAAQADGFVFGTPVYYAHPSGRILCALARAPAGRGRAGCGGPADHAQHRAEHGLAAQVHRSRESRGHRRPRCRAWPDDELHPLAWTARLRASSASSRGRMTNRVRYLDRPDCEPHPLVCLAPRRYLMHS